MEHTQKKELLINVVERVVVNLEGEIERVDLLPPFAYLYEICEKVQDGEETSENASETQTGDMVATCSSQVLLGEPPNTQNEPLVPHINIENFAQYVELTAYPQRSALEPLLTERKV